MQHQLYIVGTGSQARYVIENVRRGLNGKFTGGDEYTIGGLIDLENPQRVGVIINGHEIIGLMSNIAEKVDPKGARVIVAYGKNKEKEAVVEQLERLGYKFATIVSSAAYVSDFVEIGEGSIVNQNATIMPNAQIGRHVIIHSGDVIEHDANIGDYANIAPGVNFGGRVTIGKGAYVYLGANLVPDVVVGDYAIVGAGTLVRENVEANTTVIGVPARVLRRGPKPK